MFVSQYFAFDNDLRLKIYKFLFTVSFTSASFHFVVYCVFIFHMTCLGFAHSVEASWRFRGSEAWRLGVGSSWEIAGKASWRLPGGSWEKGNVKFMCGSFLKSFIKFAGLLPGASGRLLGGRQCQNYVWILL